MPELIRRRAAVVIPVSLDGVHPVLARVFASRGIQRIEETELSLDQLLPPDSLTGLRPAASLLADSLKRGESIMIVGDFDADGATSTAVAVSALRAMPPPTRGAIFRVSLRRALPAEGALRELSAMNMTEKIRPGPPASEGYTLITPLLHRSTYLIDINGQIVHSWEHEFTPHAVTYLLPNGHLLRTAGTRNPHPNPALRRCVYDNCRPDRRGVPRTLGPVAGRS